jgi:cytochrome c oxidase subunit 3
MSTMDSTPQAHETQAKHAGGAAHATTDGVHGHDHDHSEYPFLAHHFDSPQQQFDAGKLGIWLFLLTEVLFFSGLFCAYTVYRAIHPEVFVYAHYYLNTNLGALNTCVLLLSSLTAAWSVRNAQLGETKLLVTNIAITIVCAFTFMGVKYVEYSHKFHDRLLWGRNFDPQEQVWELESFRSKHPESAEYAEKLHAASAHAASAGAGAVAAAPIAKPSAEVLEPLLKAGIIGPNAVNPTGVSRPRNAHAFFGIYFFMTALHGFHVLAGIGVWVWLLIRATKGVFGPKYFGPIDYAALYWHLVDLIWIYLFPLLYLIH